MSKYEVYFEDTDIYRVTVDAKDEEEAQKLAEDLHGDAHHQIIDGRCEITEIKELIPPEK